MEYVTPVLWAARFTGKATAADVAAVVQKLTALTGNAWSVDSLTDTTLTLLETSANGLLSALWPIQVGQVVIVDPRVGIVDRLMPADFAVRYRRQSDLVVDLETAVAADPTFVAKIAAAVTAPVPTPIPGGGRK